MAHRRGIKLEASGSHGFDSLRECRSYPLTLGFSCRLTEENRLSYFFFSNVDFSALIVLNWTTQLDWNREEIHPACRRNCSSQKLLSCISYILFHLLQSGRWHHLPKLRSSKNPFDGLCQLLPGHQSKGKAQMSCKVKCQLKRCGQNFNKMLIEFGFFLIMNFWGSYYGIMLSSKENIWKDFDEILAKWSKGPLNSCLWLYKEIVTLKGLHISFLND